MSGSSSGTTAVRDTHRFDERRLHDWMVANVEDYAGPLSVEQFRGGQSNPTYKLVTPGGNYVLRRKPPGQLLRGAHAVDREYQVLRALAGTDVPVARAFGLCNDDDVIGTAFYVMDMVDGRIFWDASFPEVARADRPAYVDAMTTTIGRLHAIDPAAVGLGEYGRPGNYFARQIARWSRQYLEDTEAGTDPNMDRLVEALPAAIPPGDETTIVHGDFRCDNLIFHPTEPRILAVLDWELSTLGHPLADFAYYAMMYRIPPNIVTGLGGADLAALNIPDEAATIARYCRLTRRDRIDHYDFYVAFNAFRLAAILHGIAGRIVRGTATSAEARDRAAAFPVLAAFGVEQLNR